jgi:hypothetical protein
MIDRRALAVAAIGFVLATHSLQSQGRARYRDFQLGGDLPSISALTGIAVSQVKTIHQRPAMMQELQWSRPYSLSGTTQEQTDPVKQILFSFYNDQLSRMVVDYDPERTAGLTDADLVDAIALEYGAPSKPGATVPKAGSTSSRPLRSQIEDESGTPIARWAGADYSVVLYHYRSYASSFRLIVASPRLDALARAADLQAIKLDDREAPQRETARQKKETDDLRAAQAKARVANKATFRP